MERHIMGGVRSATVDGVVISMRDWSIGTLQLDEGQIAAAHRFHDAWQTVQSLRPAAASFTERIDGGRVGDAYPERRLKAAADLRHCRILLGEHGYSLVGRVCGDGYHIRDMYQSRRERDTAGDVLRIHLSALAAMWR